MRQHSVDPSRAGWVGVARYWDTVPGGLHSANLCGGQDKERRPPGWGVGVGEGPRAGRRCHPRPRVPGASWRQVGQQVPGSCMATSPCRGRRGPQSAQEEGPEPHTACLRPRDHPLGRDPGRSPGPRGSGGYLGTGELGAVLGADTLPADTAAALTGLLPLRSRLGRGGQNLLSTHPSPPQTFLLPSAPTPSPPRGPARAVD